MSRVVVTIGCGESLPPLHRAVAAARLRSNIGVDSASWSCPSQASLPVNVCLCVIPVKFWILVKILSGFHFFVILVFEFACLVFVFGPFLCFLMIYILHSLPNAK